MPKKRTSERATKQQKKIDAQSAREKASVKRDLAKLKPLVEMLRKISLDDPPVKNFIKASFIKAYEFAQFAHGRLNHDFAFHCLGGLRSICEDLIILKFVEGLESKDQETALIGTMEQSVDDSIHRQVPFFATFRIGQPILNISVDSKTLAKRKSDFIRLWQINGWPKKKDAKWPPTSQIAHKVGPGTIDVMYDYIYRLTSDVVHFSPRALLRTGWGEDAGTKNFEISTANLGPYYTRFCRVYGIFLLTVYFEFFGDMLGMDDTVALHVRRLRYSLIMQNRWPEMITFEEMNIPLPAGNPFAHFTHSVLATQFEDGFITQAGKQDQKIRVTKSGS